MLFCNILHIWQVDLNNRVFDTMAAILILLQNFEFLLWLGWFAADISSSKKSHYLSKKNFKKKAAKIFISFNELPFFF